MLVKNKMDFDYPNIFHFFYEIDWRAILPKNWYAFFDNKSVAGLIQVFVGAGLLGKLSQVRDEKKARQDEAIKFVEEIADLLNSALTQLFIIVKGKKYENLPQLDELTGILFKKRMSVRVRSKAILKSDDFWKEYDVLIRQIVYCHSIIDNFYKHNDVKITKEEIREKIINLSILEKTDQFTSMELEIPWKELLVWSEYLWQGSDRLLSLSLKSAIRSGGSFHIPANKRMHSDARHT